MGHATTHRKLRHQVGGQAARALVAGELTLGQIIGLTAGERAALGRAVASHQRAGRIDQALALCGLIAAHEPLRADSWRPLPTLLQQAGAPVAADGVRALIDALRGEGATR